MLACVNNISENVHVEDLHVATPTRFDPMPSVASLRGEAHRVWLGCC